MKRVGIYYRVSTDKQDLASQKSAVAAYLKELPASKKPSLILEFEDQGRSGKDNQRPAYLALIKAAQDNKIDTVMVYRLDRLSRNATEAIQLILSLDVIEVSFISVTQPVLSMGRENPFRRTMLAAFSEIAEIEHDIIISRVTAGLIAAKKRGVKLGRPRREDEALNSKIDELRADGKSFGEISRELGVSKTSIQRHLKKIPSP